LSKNMKGRYPLKDLSTEKIIIIDFKAVS